MRTRLLVGALLLLAAAMAFGQTASETITVSYVEVPVTVVGRDGNPVRGLKAENFELYDDGRKRPVTSFDMVDFSSLESVKASSPLNPAARRNFLLVFDLTFSSPVAIGRAQQAARDFVTKMVQRRDRVGVATVDVDRGFRLLTSFTTDRVLVDSAISNPQSFRGNDPLQLAGNFPFAEQKSFGSTGDDKNGGQQEFNDLVRRQNAVEDQYNRTKIDRQVKLLADLVTTLRAVSGQKHLVFLSEGFDPRLIQGRDASLTQQQADENQAIEHGEIWKVDSDNRYGSTSSMSLLDRMSQAAKRSDVVLDAVDIMGVRTGVDASAGIERKSNEGLHLLANATGGAVFKNSNNLASEFQRVIKAQEVVYVLGFQAPASQPGKPHNLKVKLVGVPGARVSHRTAYYEAGGGNVVERSLTNAEIVLNDIPQEAIRMAALTAPFPTTSDNAQVPVILEVNGADLVAAARKNTATAEVFVYAFDEEGLVRDSLYQRLGLDVSKVGDTLKKSGVKYYATLSLPPGSYAVKALVRVAETDHKGFVRNNVVVPAPGDVTISQPFFFEEPGRWLMVKGGTHDKTNAPYPFEVNGETFIPSAGVRLRRGEPRKFAVFVQNASPDELHVETNPRATIVSQLKSAGGSKLVLQLDTAEAGASAMSVTIRRSSGGDQRTSSIPISIQ